MTIRPLLLASGALLATASLAACSSGASSTESTSAAGPVSVVASTDVYGSIAQAIGGSDVDVTSIITDPAQDPHSFEATARDQLTLSKAAIVIENGGGYDPFVDDMLASSDTDPVVLNASEISGLMPDDAGHTDEPAEAGHTDGADASHDGDDHDHVEGFNEHVWYSFSAMDALARHLADSLGEVDPANAATYESNYQGYSAELATLTASAEQIKAAHGGEGVAITEPVPLYLLEAAGLENRTPAEFSEAIEEGTDVPPLVLQQTLALFTNRSVALLAYNEQTSGAETEQVSAAATAAGIPVVDFTETLPAGDDYVSWMTANVAALSSALG